MRNKTIFPRTIAPKCYDLQRQSHFTLVYDARQRVQIVVKHMLLHNNNGLNDRPGATVMQWLVGTLERVSGHQRWIGKPFADETCLKAGCGWFWFRMTLLILMNFHA
jgi:hypothetical protein